MFSRKNIELEENIKTKLKQNTALVRDLEQLKVAFESKPEAQLKTFEVINNPNRYESQGPAPPPQIQSFANDTLNEKLLSSEIEYLKTKLTFEKKRLENAESEINRLKDSLDHYRGNNLDEASTVQLIKKEFQAKIQDLNSENIVLLQNMD